MRVQIYLETALMVIKMYLQSGIFSYICYLTWQEIVIYMYLILVVYYISRASFSIINLRYKDRFVTIYSPIFLSVYLSVWLDKEQFGKYDRRRGFRLRLLILWSRWISLSWLLYSDSPYSAPDDKNVTFLLSQRGFFHIGISSLYFKK